ncbi:unnamed protein product [Rotaria sp. Silwood2]|nr:unnamed protein product [Rotaria sp. Silwood2]CAF4003054.1 unnamed protein product [Rotaria sp. Silwood2]
MDVFLHDLNHAYSTGQLAIDDNTLLRYFDYATIEQHSPMTAASVFWFDSLRDSKIDQSLPLPFDRYRLSDEHRTGRGISVCFDFGEDLSHDFLAYSSSNGINVEQLALATYYIFLFKLTNGKSDLCIGMNTHGRYKEELMTVIGMFVNAIPLRCQLDPHWHFNQLLEHVKKITTSSLQYSYFPLQRILAQHPSISKPAFLETSFDFHTYTSTNSKDEVMIENARLITTPFSIKLGEDEIMSESFYVTLLDHIKNIDFQNCRIWNMYGPAETTISSTFNLINLAGCEESIGIGIPLPNYRCLLLDEFLQSVVIGQEGELLVGGVGVYAGYLGRDDMTEKILIEVDGEIFYRTGDLVRIDHNGLLHYRTRKDHQIKLHGQRIELGEIEQCLLNTSIAACVVIKWGDDHLVAYVQSSNIDEKQLREHCKSHLPPHMIPSIFLILEKLPINANGKIDRKLLPTPNMSSVALQSTNEFNVSRSQMEETVHTVWCKVLGWVGQEISTRKSFFNIGGHSLLFIKLYHSYQTLFGFDTHVLSIASFLEQPTIFEHAKLLEKVATSDMKSTQWHTLHLIQGIASFAQERILLDEQIRFTKKVAIYNELIVLKVFKGSLSINRLLSTFRSLLTKHPILRTSLVFNNESGTLKQYITDRHETFTLAAEQTFRNDRELLDIIYQTTTDPNLFDLSSGRIFYCQILRLQNSLKKNNDNEFITYSDVLIIAFHHAAFDRFSREILYNDLCQAYNNSLIIPVDEERLQYIDYSVYERQIDMTLSREFWHKHLQGYNFECRFSLPIDRHRSSPNERSGCASVAKISFDNDISTAFLNYASSHKVTPFQLGLATFYAFLFKLSHSQRDLCITCPNANRYKSELENIIGMFVATLPHRIQLNSHWSFDELVSHVREQCLSIFEHSHYPLQYILADSYLEASNVSFLEIMFDFITVSSEKDHLFLNDATLEEVSLEQSSQVAKFDFMLIFVYNPALVNSRLSCYFICSHDLYDVSTIETIGERFQYLFFQLFSSKSSITQIDQAITPINKLSLILHNEAQEMQGTIFYRLLNIVNEGMFICCILLYVHDSP